MRKLVVILVLAVALAFTAPVHAGSKSDKQIALEWATSHGGGYTVEAVKTVSKGGYKGKAGKWSVKYPKKVKKGKKVTVYMIEKNGDVCAMVCMGKVK